MSVLIMMVFRDGIDKHYNIIYQCGIDKHYNIIYQCGIDKHWLLALYQEMLANTLTSKASNVMHSKILYMKSYKYSLKTQEIYCYIIYYNKYYGVFNEYS
jgi:hypothetical protein